MEKIKNPAFVCRPDEIRNLKIDNQHVPYTVVKYDVLSKSKNICLKSIEKVDSKTVETIIPLDLIANGSVIIYNIIENSQSKNIITENLTDEENIILSERVNPSKYETTRDIEEMALIHSTSARL